MIEARASADWLPGNITHVVAMPDTLLSPLLGRVGAGVSYLQTVHEAQAIGLAAGLIVGGAIPLVCMENSGLRAACESLARLVVLHGIKIPLLLSARGAAEDANWWSVNHGRDAVTLIQMFGFRQIVPDNSIGLSRAVEMAADIATRRVASVVVVASPAILADVLHAEP